MRQKVLFRSEDGLSFFPGLGVVRYFHDLAALECEALFLAA